MAESTIYPDVYGFIDATGPTAHDQSGTTGSCYTHRTTSADVVRAYFSFDTSAIPTNATVSAAVLRLYLDDIDLPVGISLNNVGIQVWYDHDRIGVGIDTSDWQMNSYAGYKYVGSQPFSLPYHLDVTVVTGSVNPGGDSDYEVRDASVWADSVDGPLCYFHARHGSPATDKTWLTVTWTAPRGLFNRFNRWLPALPGFSNVLAMMELPCGRIQVVQQFAPRLRIAEA